MLVQPDLCRTCSETILLVFPRGGSNDLYVKGNNVHTDALGFVNNVMFIEIEAFN